MNVISIITGSVTAELSPQETGGWIVAGFFLFFWGISMYIISRKNQEINKLKKLNKKHLNSIKHMK